MLRGALHRQAALYPRPPAAQHPPTILPPAVPTPRSWFDLDLSTKPYRSLRYHQYAIRGTAFHRSYPLFASASDDATVHIFHGMVYSDLMTNPLIVPGADANLGEQLRCTGLRGLPAA